MLEAKSISKRFGATVALDCVDFAARPGEIHALLGENGAGKTTLMNIFAGMLRPDQGDATLDGAPLRTGSPGAALSAGIAAVHQSPMLFERMTWEENLALGGFGRERGLLDLDAVASRADTLARRLGFELPPRGVTIERRSVAERVRLEVLRALSFDPRVLILDEPTGVLSPAELSSFLELLRRLRGEGRIVVLITHKLGEAMAVADRITILRRGRVVAETTPSQTSERELARTMIGENIVEPERSRSSALDSPPLFRIENLSCASDGAPALDRISLSIGRGEIAGIAGVDGNGQVELVEVIAGVRRPSSGSVRIPGDDASSSLAVIPQNRDLDGLILDLPVWENLLLVKSVRARVSWRGWLDPARARSLCANLLANFRIRAAGPDAPASSLSGGNRQRLEVARAIAQNPRVIVAHNVCRGLDFAATAEVHRTLVEFARAGGAVLLVSSDLDELLAIADRLFVISRGRVRETTPAERSPESLGLLMAGRF